MAPCMHSKCIFGWAKLGADLAVVPLRGHMVGLYVPPQVSQILAGVGTIGTPPNRATLCTFLDHL